VPGRRSKADELVPEAEAPVGEGSVMHGGSWRNGGLPGFCPSVPLNHFSVFLSDQTFHHKEAEEIGTLGIISACL